MRKLQTRIINNCEFYATKRVRLNDQVYQEYKTTDPMRPDTIYIDSTGEIVDEKTHAQLKEKFGIRMNSKDGRIVIYD